MAHFVYRCSECGRTYDRDAVRYLCPACSEIKVSRGPLRGVLEAVFDSAYVTRHFCCQHPEWSFFCAVEPAFHPPFPVGDTPLVKAPRLNEATGFENLHIKNDGLNPTASLKDRASELMVAEAIRLGEDRVVTASTGNAAVALAAACAAAGKTAIIFVPERAPRAKLAQLLIHGARVVRVRGTYDDATQLSRAYTDARGGLNRNTGYHPLTIEGKKTVALEIAAQLGFAVPDAVIVPVGDGVILAGVHKGFRDLRDAGILRRLPRLIGVQADSSDAIHHYVTTGEYRNAASPSTIADSISVSAPACAHLAKRAIEESGGFTVLVSDAEIREGQALLARTTGIFAEPAASTTVAALRKIHVDRLPRNATVVLLITGHGLKDVESAMANLPIPEPIEPRLEDVP